MVDLAQPISEWKDIESNKEDDQYLGDICFSLRYVPTSGKVWSYRVLLHLEVNIETGRTRIYASEGLKGKVLFKEK